MLLKSCDTYSIKAKILILSYAGYGIFFRQCNKVKINCFLVEFQAVQNRCFDQNGKGQCGVFSPQTVTNIK